MRNLPPVTTVLIAICVAVSLFSRLGESQDFLRFLLISDPVSGGLEDIASGQLWRLITPAFIHFGILHLVFNMMWLWDLGGLIEGKKGATYLAGFVFATGVASNLVQYQLGGSPFFGGMSGVVYGLLGYVWMQSRFNPRAGYLLHKNTVIMMLGWYVLCWTGLLGPIANWAHTAGLLIGVGWGYGTRNR